MWNFLKSLFNIRVSSSRTRQPNANGFVSLSPPSSDKITFMMNDPATPALCEEISIPTLPAICPAFSVQGWAGAGREFSTVEGHAAQVYAAIVKTLTFFQHTVSAPIHRWAATDNLIVFPHAGQDFNAYYDRAGLHFFYGPDPVRQKVVFSCESVDVVSHELGHALLDCLRPDLWNTQCLEIFAFHESWGDMIAILTVMQSEQVLNDVLASSVENSNCVSRLAEDMGIAIYNLVAQSGRDPMRSRDSLRDAINNFHYTPPEQLPMQAPDNVLAGEPHSFSRVFTAAFYDMLIGIYNIELAKGRAPIDALRSARDVCGLLLINAIPNAPAVPRFFESVARAIQTASQGIGGQYNDAVSSAFQKRGILTTTLRALSNMKFSDVDLTNVQVASTDGHHLVKKLDVRTVKLSDYTEISAQSNHPLYSAEIEIPVQSMMKFDFAGNLVDEVKTAESHAIEAARAAINQLEKLDMVGDRKSDKFDYHFSIVDGKLVRNFIRCGCRH